MAVAVAACVDLSAPKGVPASISQIQLPAFFVVQGDTMRDTLGQVTPMSVIAYDGAGGALSAFKPAFIITDSLQQLHFSAIDSSLVSNGPADTAGAVAHVLAQIGGLQTGVQTVYVTVRPDTLRRNDTTTLVLNAPFGIKLDSSESIGRLALSTVVRGAGGRVVPGVFVRYTLKSSITSKNNSPVAYLTDDANAVFPVNVSTPDTGDVSGVTSRTLVLNTFLASKGDDLVTDLVVEVTALYRGAPLKGSPLRLVIPVHTVLP